MADGTNIAAFANGRWTVLSEGGKKGETVLALPLDRLIVKVVSIPAENAEDPVEFVRPVLDAMSPYPDEPLAISVENLRADENGVVAVAAALPEGSVADVEDALDANKTNVTRVDSLAFGALTDLWRHVQDDGQRRLLLLEGAECVSAIVADGRCPCAMRAISQGADLKRETMLLLLDAEAIGGEKALAEIVVAGGDAGHDGPAPQENAGHDGPAPQEEGGDGPAPREYVVVSGADEKALSVFAPVRRLAEPLDPLPGLVERAADPASLNVLPDGWSEILDETRFKSKMKVALSVAGGIWLAVMAAFWGMPRWYGYKTSQVTTLRMRHKSEFNKVSEKKKQVEAVAMVSNHDLGALETLRVVTSVIQEGMELSKWNFKRGDKLTFSGTVADGDERKVYTFKDGLAGVVLSQVSGLEDDDETPFFTDVTLPRGVSQRGGKAVFDVECDFKEAEEDD
jgi:hypothetical protein